MNRCGTDPKVKKTLVRNCEQKIKSSRTQVVREVEACSSNIDIDNITEKENQLSQPTLCSSETLGTYLMGLKKVTPTPFSIEDLNVDQVVLCNKITKKLNFHFNDTIYKNLIELNSTIENAKAKKDKRVSNVSTPAKKDLEPNIEDFCEDEKDIDSPPPISIVTPKFKPVRKVEDGQLHKLVASFELL